MISSSAHAWTEVALLHSRKPVTKHAINGTMTMCSHSTFSQGLLHGNCVLCYCTVAHLLQMALWVRCLRTERDASCSCCSSGACRVGSC